jgi:hypothetical protein
MQVEGFLPRPMTTITAATKANPCVITAAAVDPLRLVPNAHIYTTGTGFAALDGKWHRIVSVAGNNITLVPNTTAEAGAFTAGGALSIRDTPTPQ